MTRTTPGAHLTEESHPAPERKEPGGEPWSPRDVFGNRRLLVDTAGPPVTFVLVSRMADLPAAAYAALAVAAVLVAVRLTLGHRLRYALGGFAGVGVAVAAALVTGNAAGYFGPAMMLNAGYALVAVASIAARRPLVAWLGAFLYRWPLQWYWHPRVRPAYTEITWAWAGLFGLRAGLRLAFMASGQLEWLAVVHVVLGLPALAVLILLTYWYLQWRLPRLGGPSVEAFRVAHGTAGAPALP